MTEEEKLMEQYGITSEQKTMYYYKEYKYDKLRDALNYAKIDTERESKSAPSRT